MTRPPGGCVRAGGFTLVELLVVVSIILVLAAIATSSLADATMRSRVARVRSDLRTLAQSFEAYAVDHARYPRMPDARRGATCPLPERPSELVTGIPPNSLSTPIAYSLPSTWIDPVAAMDPSQPCQRLLFTYHRDVDLAVPSFLWDMYSSAVYGQRWDGYFLWSIGGDVFFPERIDAPGRFSLEYDPTNGTFSAGGIPRFR